MNTIYTRLSWYPSYNRTTAGPFLQDIYSLISELTKRGLTSLVVPIWWIHLTNKCWLQNFSSDFLNTSSILIDFTATVNNFHRTYDHDRFTNKQSSLSLLRQSLRKSIDYSILLQISTVWCFKTINLFKFFNAARW